MWCSACILGVELEVDISQIRRLRATQSRHALISVWILWYLNIYIHFTFCQVDGIVSYKYNYRQFSFKLVHATSSQHVCGAGLSLHWPG